MNLLQRIANIVRPASQKSIPVIDDRDSLLVGMTPRINFVDRKLRDERGNFSTIPTYKGCVDNLAARLSVIYGPQFETRESTERECVTRTFTFPTRVMSYTLQGRDRFESSDGYAWSNEVLAMLGIREKNLDRAKAKVLITQSLLDHAFDYNPASPQKFGLFFQSKQEPGIVKGGIPLLQELGIVPVDCAEYFHVMYFGGYRLRKLKPGTYEPEE